MIELKCAEAFEELFILNNWSTVDPMNLMQWKISFHILS